MRTKLYISLLALVCTAHHAHTSEEQSNNQALIMPTGQQPSSFAEIPKKTDDATLDLDKYSRLYLQSLQEIQAARKLVLQNDNIDFNQALKDVRDALKNADKDSKNG